MKVFCRFYIRMILALLTLSFLFQGNIHADDCLAPAHRQDTADEFTEACNKLSARSIPKQSLCELHKLPVWEILDVFGLTDPENIPGADTVIVEKTEDGFFKQKIKITRDKNQYGQLSPLCILYENMTLKMLPESSEHYLEFLYDNTGRLLAIYPIVSDDEYNECGRVNQGEDVKFKYLDLSAYLYDLPKINDPEYAKKIIIYQREVKKSKTIVDCYMRKNKTRCDNFCFDVQFAVFEMDRESKTPKRNYYNLCDLHKITDPMSWDSDRILIPILPSVFPADAGIDDEYYHYLYEDMSMHQAIDLLVLGPGSGIDCWISWLASGKSCQGIHAMGKNPLEVANTRITARIAGFEVDARIVEVREKGIPHVFGNKKFSRLYWNMPLANFTDVEEKKAEFSFSWDGDFNGKVLSGFAKSLNDFLDNGDALAFVWNSPQQMSFSDGIRRPVAKEILRSAGQWEYIPSDIQTPWDTSRDIFSVRQMPQDQWLYEIKRAERENHQSASSSV